MSNIGFIGQVSNVTVKMTYNLVLDRFGYTLIVYNSDKTEKYTFFFRMENDSNVYGEGFDTFLTALKEKNVPGVEFDL